jgi:hypothetical protein
MQFLGRWVAQVRSSQPAQRSCRIDRDCPLDTARARCLWHADGTAGENNAAPQPYGDGSQLDRRVRPVLGDHRPAGKCPEGSRQPGGETRTYMSPISPAQGQDATGRVTSSFDERLVSAPARCCPRFARRLRTQHGPTRWPVRHSGHLAAGCPLLEPRLRVTAYSTRYRRKEET